MNNENDDRELEIQKEIGVRFASRLKSVAVRADRLFAILMLVQFVGCIIAAIIVTPHTWKGAESSIHFHVWTAVIFGGVLAIPTAAMAWLRPGNTWNRFALRFRRCYFPV